MRFSRMNSSDLISPGSSHLPEADCPSSPTFSSASSSSSVFSTDGQSSQSSAPSSSKTTVLSWDGDVNNNKNVHLSAASTIGLQQLPTRHAPESNNRAKLACVDARLRTHPRRTCPSNASHGCVEFRQASRPPPHLIRQSDRKDNFVESLVDTTTQMIEVIWPLSVIPCGRDAVLGGKNLIGLRTFIQEVLKRSKTSYSTLQVALYYLVLIKSRVPKADFTNMQSEDSHASRAMQCGRRMFLAALILASKYLQDRNYSARAWSKISGLKISEINSNEIAFVTAVEWDLHVPEALFQRWTDVVLRFSQSPPIISCSYALKTPLPSWRALVARLTPGLEIVDDIDAMRSATAASFTEEESAFPSNKITTMPPPCPEAFAPSKNITTSPPHPSNSDAVDLVPSSLLHDQRVQSILPAAYQLPTPESTPGAHSSSTPAMCYTGSYITKSSMSRTMQQIQSRSMRSCTLDKWPLHNTPTNARLQVSTPATRKPYIVGPASTTSSPESSTFDVLGLSHSSRESSMSCNLYNGAPSQHAKGSSLVDRQCAASNGLNKGSAYGYSQRVASSFESRWTTAATVPNTTQESFVRGLRDPTEMASTSIDATHIDGSRSRVSLCPTSLAGHKRDRSNSTTATYLQDELRLLLAASRHILDETSGGAVVSDIRDVKSSMPRGSHALASAPTTSFDPVVADRCYEPRKRLCCQ